MNIHEEHYDVLVRTPMICQNGHQRWLYHLISRGDLRTLWGPRGCDCDCPTGEMDEGFAALGPSHAVLEEADYDRSGAGEAILTLFS